MIMLFKSREQTEYGQMDLEYLPYYVPFWEQPIKMKSEDNGRHNHE